MNWQLWIVVALQASAALLTVGNVGKDRKPIDSTTAVVSVIVSSIIVGLIVWGANT